MSLLNRSGTTKSRKNAANADLATGRPTDLLIARADQWKAIVKGLLAYYEGLAAAERHQGGEITKHASDLPLPFSASSQFQQEGTGWQPTLYSVRDHTKKIADLHNALASKIDSAVVSELTSIRAEIKSHTHGIMEDGGKKADVVDKERELSTTALGKLGHAVATVGQQRAAAPTAAEDPFIAHSVVERQLANQVERENELQTATLRHQRDTERHEQDWSRRLQAISKAYSDAQATYSERIKAENAEITKLIAAVPAEGEWNALTQGEHNYLIPSDAPIREVANIQFPSQNHESAQVVKSGLLERKTRIVKKYGEAFVVLTASGFMHTYDKDPTSVSRESDPKSIAQPTLSLYLPNSSLGPPAPASSSKHKFYIEAVKASAKKESKFKLGGKKDKDYTFRGRSHEEMMAWHSAIEKLVGNTISHDSTASTSSKHKGEVTSTVAGVGLASSGASTTTATTVEEAAAAEEEDDEGSSEEEEGESEFVEAADASTPGAGTTGEGEAGSVRFGESTTIGEQDALPGYTGNGAQVPAEKKAPLEGDNAHQALAAGEGTSGGAVPTVSDGATSSDKHDLPPALSSASSSTPQAAVPGASTTTSA